MQCPPGSATLKQGRLGRGGDNGSLDYGDHEMVEMKMLTGVRKGSGSVDPGAEGSRLCHI